MDGFFLDYECEKQEDGEFISQLSCSFIEEPAKICFAACEALLFAMHIEKDETDKSKEQIFQECLNHLTYFLKEDTMINLHTKQINKKDEILNNISEN